MSGRLRRGVGAVAAAGLLAGTLSGCFSSPPQIVTLDPGRDAAGVPADTTITVQFDKAVVTSSVASRFSVTPPIPRCDLRRAFDPAPGDACSVRWINGDTGFVLEHPGAVLSAATRYTFDLAAGVEGPDGAVNGLDHKWDITTGSAPAVRAFSPADGATGVASDLPLSVAFTTIMAAGTTRDAITLTPSVPGTRVIRDPTDHTRFLVLPGRPLLDGTRYRLSVAARATDEHGLPIAAPASAAFVAGPLSTGTHAVVLAGSAGEGATAVMLAPVQAQDPGDPVGAETLLEVPRCPGPATCGAATAGSPLYTYSGAALSPDARWLAVVERDRTVARGTPTLVVLDAARGDVVASVPNGDLPAWSHDGTTLAFQVGAGAALLSPVTGATTQLPAGDPLTAAPAWAPGDEAVVLATSDGTGNERVEMADTLVVARYPIAPFTLDAVSPRISPGGTLAVYRTSGGAGGTWIASLGGSAAPRPVGADVVPVGWADSDTLVGTAGARSGGPALVTLSVGGVVTPINPQPPALSLPSVSLASSGRFFAFIGHGVLGIAQVLVENVGGGAPVTVTAFSSGALQAQAVTLS